jgi:hypothetical protein
MDKHGRLGGGTIGDTPWEGTPPSPLASVAQ